LVAERWTSSVELALRGTLLRGSGNAFGDPFGLCRVELSQDASHEATISRGEINLTGSDTHPSNGERDQPLVHGGAAW